MTDAATTSLVVMAVALVVMALVQLGVTLAALRATRQMMATVEQVRRDVTPLVQKAQKIADDAARVSALAVIQAERVDSFLAATAQRLDETLVAVRDFVAGPMRQSSALVTAIRAAVGVVRDWHATREKPAREADEDAMFVG